MRSKRQEQGAGEQQGVLTRLRHDKRGNTLAIMAASLVPMIGFSGSAIDMARIYVVKVRLQQACDAGALATRKTMADTQLSTPLDANAAAQGQAFFKNNFKAGWYQSTAVAFTPVKAATETGTTNVANAITGSATATIPMTLIKFFGMKTYKLTVGCQAVYDMADTDVMFVLDTTGSMSCKPSDPSDCANPVTSYTKDGVTRYYNPESSGSKLAALRNAVTVFDTTMRSSADASTHFRYGFVTYSSSVNVGRSIYDVSPSYLQDDAPYQSRFVQRDYNAGDPTSFTLTNINRSTCQAQRYPAGLTYALTGPTWSNQGYYQARNYYNVSWTSANNGTCTGLQQAVRPVWRYDLTWFDVRQWVRSVLPNSTAVANPSRLDGSGSTWRGCVEELDTNGGDSFDVNDLPDDLDPDIKPTATTNRWRPQWPDLIWNREYFGYQDMKDENVVEYGVSAEWRRRNLNAPLYARNYGTGYYYDDTGSAPCGMPAQRLKVWTAQQVKDYLNDPDFKPFGGTYHDVGMIWGTRMLSPKGIFAADTAAWPGRKEPNRNIVFMTDGTMAPSQFSYGQYGVEIYDNRTGGQNNDTQDYKNHTARFRVECDAAKKKGFTIYVVALGTALTSDLTYCASPGQAFQASSDATLSAYFRTIAQRIAMLRIQK